VEILKEEGRKETGGPVDTGTRRTDIVFGCKSGISESPRRRVPLSPRRRVLSSFLLFDDASLGGLDKRDELSYLRTIGVQFLDLLEGLRGV